MTDLISLLSERGMYLKKRGNAYGGEFSTSCPVCGDGGKGPKSDRFHIWPFCPTAGLCDGRFWCRQCGISGDPITFLRTVDNLSFAEACIALGITPPKRDTAPRRYQPPPVRQKKEPPWKPPVYPPPPELWQDKAEELLKNAQERLSGDSAALEWLATRGINRPMTAIYGLGYNVSSRGGDRYRKRESWGLPSRKQGGRLKKLWIPQGWVIPARDENGKLTQLRIRRRNEDMAAFAGDISYLPIDGSSAATLVLHPEAEVFVIVESGLDAVLLAGVMCGKIGVICTWNCSARPDIRAHTLLKNCGVILGALDYDEGGDNQQQWWRSQYPHYRRLPALPGGAKDPGDAFAQGVNLRQWLIAGMPAGMRIKMGLDAPRRKTSTRSLPQTTRLAVDPSLTGKQTPPVMEVALKDGQIIYLTDDKKNWQQLAASGKPVFTRNELSRLKKVTDRMSDSESADAAIKVALLKEVFPAYIRGSRVKRKEETVCQQ